MIRLRTPVVLTTAGDGYWSRKQANVKVTSFSMPYLNGKRDFGELRVFFDTDTWNVKTDGLIYTDSKFESELKTLLDTLGLAGSNVTYSEQGMQGRDYVSCDVGKAFIDSWEKIAVVTV